jgi:DNA-directed RNA polymerase specialized sigma subunit, sigma24 homolog
MRGLSEKHLEVKEIEDREIVGLYLARDDEAIERTREKYGERLRRLAYEITEDRQTAEECEDDAYLRAWNSIPPHEPNDYLYRFLVRLLRNSALNCCRGRSAAKRKALIEELTEELGNTLPSRECVEESVNGHQLTQTVNTFLSTLPDVFLCKGKNNGAQHLYDNAQLVENYTTSHGLRAAIFCFGNCYNAVIYHNNIRYEFQLNAYHGSGDINDLKAFLDTLTDR